MKLEIKKKKKLNGGRTYKVQIQLSHINHPNSKTPAYRPDRKNPNPKPTFFSRADEWRSHGNDVQAMAFGVDRSGGCRLGTWHVWAATAAANLPSLGLDAREWNASF